VWVWLQTIGRSAMRSFIGADQDGPPHLRSVADADGALQILQALPRWAVEDLGQALMAMGSMTFAVGLGISAVAFMLLVVRRARGA
jgi:hypothetical protein